MSEQHNATTGLVIGASGAIGGAVLQQFLQDPRLQSVVAVSRSPAQVAADKLTWLQTDHSDASIAAIVDQLADTDLRRVIISTGTLHGDDFQPEKMLEHLDAAAMQQVFSVNVITPALWLRHLAPRLKKADAVVAVLSARVGSIGDNRSGGWYSYRSSKAALNMLLQSASIELRRRAPGVKLLAFHPGTTDSALSKPFQKNVPPEKLFAPAFVAEQLVSIMDEAPRDGQLSFVDWQGKDIPW